MAWYASDAGTFAVAPAVTRNDPKYLTPLLGCHPRIGRPISATTILATKIGPRKW